MGGVVWATLERSCPCMAEEVEVPGLWHRAAHPRAFSVLCSFKSRHLR